MISDSDVASGTNFERDQEPPARCSPGEQLDRIIPIKKEIWFVSWQMPLIGPDRLALRQ